MVYNIQPQIICLKSGSYEELSNDRAFKARDREQRMAGIVLYNLTTNTPQVATVRYEVTRFSNRTLFDKINLIKIHFYQYKDEYIDLAISLAMTFVAVIVAVVAAQYMIHHLAVFKQEIINGMWEFAPVIGCPELVTLLDYDVYALDMWASYLFMTSFLALPLLIFNTVCILSFANSWFNKFQDPAKLECHIELSETSYPVNDVSQLANNHSVDTQSPIDPISLNPIHNRWVHAPRFLKIGPYLFTLDSCLQGIYRKALVNQMIQHPVEVGRVLTPQEQEKLITDLSQLLCLDKTEILKYFDPYYISWDKFRLMQDPQYINAPMEEKDAVLENLLFHLDLSRMIPDWETFRPDQKGAIKNAIRERFFTTRRLTNILRESPEIIRLLRIRNAEDDGFSIQELLDEQSARTYEYPILA